MCTTLLLILRAHFYQIKVIMRNYDKSVPKIITRIGLIFPTILIEF